MSLLMDALKKAELAKRKAQSDSASASPGAPAEAASAHETAEAFAPQTQGVHPPTVSTPHHPRSASPLPSLPDHLELLDDEFSVPPAAGAPEHPPAPTPSRFSSSGEDALSLQAIEAPAASPAAKHIEPAGADAAEDREAVRNLFETKQAPASRKSFAIAIGAATLVAVAGIGGYFWYQLQPKSTLLAPPASVPSRPQPIIPIASPPQAALPAQAPEEEPPAEAVAPKREAAEAPPVKTQAPAEKKLFRVSKAVAIPQTDPALERGYAALNRDDATAAKAAYEQALGNDPRNIDALSGLAVLAQRAGNPELAADYYLRILEADPHHAFALAGLIGLQSRLSPVEAETRLKQALSAQPDSAALNFSLGNLHASSKRWPEAQQAYFKAVTADAGNPDYLFNLAVSLDQLRQPKLAANYYAQALAATSNRPASFDKAKASERLRQLQQ